MNVEKFAYMEWIKELNLSLLVLVQIKYYILLVSVSKEKYQKPLNPVHD